MGHHLDNHLEAQWAHRLNKTIWVDHRLQEDLYHLEINHLLRLEDLNNLDQVDNLLACHKIRDHQCNNEASEVHLLWIKIGLWEVKHHQEVQTIQWIQIDRWLVNQLLQFFWTPDHHHERDSINHHNKDSTHHLKVWTTAHHKLLVHRHSNNRNLSSKIILQWTQTIMASIISTQINRWCHKIISTKTWIKTKGLTLIIIIDHGNLETRDQTCCRKRLAYSLLATTSTLGRKGLEGQDPIKALINRTIPFRMEASTNNRIIPSSKIMGRAIITLTTTSAITTSTITIPFSNKMGSITITITSAMGWCKIQTNLIKQPQC